MLYAGPGSDLRYDALTSTVHCHLCRKCAGSLSTKNAKGLPAPRMPLLARARGLWLGPEPEAIRLLTYAERRVLRLSRVYASVKRVMTKEFPWAGGNAAAVPQYTTRNVVAYTQDPDVAVRIACCLLTCARICTCNSRGPMFIVS